MLNWYLPQVRATWRDLQRSCIAISLRISHVYCTITIKCWAILAQVIVTTAFIITSIVTITVSTMKSSISMPIFPKKQPNRTHRGGPCSPLELPEILFLLAPHVEHRGLDMVCASSQVCKSWHRIFGPLVWTDVPVGCQNAPNFTSLNTHRRLVRSLTLNSETPLRYVLQIHYPSLTCLIISTDFCGRTVRDLICRHGLTLKEIRLLGKPLFTTSTSDNVRWDLWQTLLELPRLQILELARMTVLNDSESVRLFWSVCSRPGLKELYLDSVTLGVNLTSTPEMKDIGLLTLKRVHFMNIHCPRSTADGLARLVFCSRELKELEWSVLVQSWTSQTLYFPLVPLSEGEKERAKIVVTASEDQKGKGKEVHRTGSSVRWPCLSKLRVPVGNLDDEHIVELLNSIGPELEEIMLERSGFEQAATNALIARHARSLKHLNLMWCRRLSMSMVVDILTRCPLLEDVAHDSDLR